MAKLKITITSHRKYDLSEKGIILGIHSYHPPGPWAAKIVEFVEAINSDLSKKGQKKLRMNCHIAKMDGPMAVIILKGKKENILNTINTYLSKSDILKSFDMEVKQCFI